jgi:hypothetical protein
VLMDLWMDLGAVGRGVGLVSDGGEGSVNAALRFEIDQVGLDDVRIGSLFGCFNSFLFYLSM